MADTFTMIAGRGFGIPARNDPKWLKDIVTEVEGLGYKSFWTNDTPMADGLECLALAASVSSMHLGVGVIPIDRRPVEEIAKRILMLELPLERIVIGIGAGFSQRPIGDVADAAKKLRDLLGESSTIGIAAMGPSMCKKAGEIADVVLLNWMTPERIGFSRDLISDGAKKGKGIEPVVGAYVRVAVGPDGRDLLAREAHGYAAMPHYARHFETMGAEPSSVGIAGPDPERSVIEYERVLDFTVVRAIPVDQTTNATIDVAHALAPSYH